MMANIKNADAAKATRLDAKLDCINILLKDALADASDPVVVDALQNAHHIMTSRAQVKVLDTPATDRTGAVEQHTIVIHSPRPKSTCLKIASGVKYLAVLLCFTALSSLILPFSFPLLHNVTAGCISTYSPGGWGIAYRDWRQKEHTMAEVRLAMEQAKREFDQRLALGTLAAETEARSRDQRIVEAQLAIAQAQEQRVQSDWKVGHRLATATSTAQLVQLRMQFAEDLNAIHKYQNKHHHSFWDSVVEHINFQSVKS